MPESMIRKQIYLGRDQNRKIKSLAAQRGCTESELIREAVDRLPDPHGDILDQLRSLGLIEDQNGVTSPTGSRLEELEAEVDAWVREISGGLRLSAALDADRDER